MCHLESDTWGCGCSVLGLRAATCAHAEHHAAAPGTDLSPAASAAAAIAFICRMLVISRPSDWHA